MFHGEIEGIPKELLSVLQNYQNSSLYRQNSRSNYIIFRFFQYETLWNLNLNTVKFIISHDYEYFTLE